MKLCIFMLFNDFVMALNIYSWWFHGDRMAGYFGLGCFVILIVCAFIATGSSRKPSDGPAQERNEP